MLWYALLVWVLVLLSLDLLSLSSLFGDTLLCDVFSSLLFGQWLIVLSVEGC